MFGLKRSFITAFLTLLVLAPVASSQGTVPFTLRLEQDDIVTAFPNGSTATLAATAVGVPATAALTITYTGSGAATIETLDVLDAFNIPSTVFSVVGLPTLPLTLAQNQSVTVTLRYLPANSQRRTSRALFGYSEGGPIGTITVNMAGVAPEFAYSYIPQGGNPTVLAPGGAINFPATTINSVSTATVVIANQGSGPGVVGGFTASGPAFSLTGLPLPPATISANKDLRFTVNYSPTALETSTGSLQLQLAAQTVTFALAGTSTGPLFLYEIVKDSTVIGVSPNQVIPLANTLVNETTSIVFRIRNSGNANASISTISVSGTGYQLSGLPFLPATIAPGGSASFIVTFAPTQPGAAVGRLKVGNDTFDLIADGLGPALEYSYTIGSVTTLVAAGGSVLLTPVPVGATATAQFIITNSGTANASVTSISVSSTGSPVFTISDLPSLPATVAPKGTLAFTVRFAPKALGAASATLKVDAQSFTLSGTGNSPATLPSYQFEGASGDQQALQQPAIGLTLSSAYSLPLTGTLTLAFNSEVFSDDPSVQFATGGRTVSFTIPANATKALFSNGSNQIRIQTGTVAGTIVLTPSFVTDGGIDLTPQSPTSLSLNVRQAAPQLLSALLLSKTTNTFTLQISGYTTSRSITEMGFQFSATSGENVSTTSLNVNVESSFLAWYQGSTSKQYGSQFAATIPFTLQGDVRSAASLVDAIQSVTVTLTNRLGNSTARTVNLR